MLERARFGAASRALFSPSEIFGGFRHVKNCKQRPVVPYNVTALGLASEPSKVFNIGECHDNTKCGTSIGNRKTVLLLCWLCTCSSSNLVVRLGIGCITLCASFSSLASP